jgi:hypothetical protein
MLQYIYQLIYGLHLILQTLSKGYAGGSGDQYGTAVALNNSGNIALVGAPYGNGYGYAEICITNDQWNTYTAISLSYYGTFI